MSLISALSNGTLSFVQQQLIAYGYSTFLVFGVSGCCLNILLLSRRQFQTSSCCIYFRAMSAVALLHILIALGLYLYTLNNVDLIGTQSVVCKMRFYIVQSTAMMYRWCLTIACFDRYALSSADVRLRNFATVKIARRVIVLIIIIWLVLVIHVPIVYSIRYNICSIFSNIAASLYQSIFSTVFGCFLPIAVMTTCALLIHRNLARKRERRQQNVHRGNEIGRLQSKRDQQVLLMLLIQMIFYTVTVVPLMGMYFYSAMTIYVTKALDRIIVERFYMFLAEMINFLFPVCLFYLYTMASHMFRVELKAMLCPLLKCRRPENNSRVDPTVQGGRTKPIGDQLPTTIANPQPIVSKLNKPESMHSTSRQPIQ